MASALGVVLLAALVLALVDVAHTGGAALAVCGLWALLFVPLAIATGVVLGAGNATWGQGWIRGGFRRLRDDADLDQKITAIVIAAAVVGGVMVLVIKRLALGLVGDVNRKSIGALLLGVITVGLVPILALGVLPLYRATRRITPVIPAVGPLPRVVLLVVAAVGAGVLGALYVVRRGLDTQSMNLPSYIAPALVPVVAIAIGIVAYGPAAQLRERIPMRGMLAATGLVIAIALVFVGLGRTPPEATQIAVTDHSYLGARLIPVLRSLIDRDHDGYSAFFGGPDCNDHDKSINPKAKEVDDDNIDQNCDGFDTHATVEDSSQQPAQPPPTLKGGDNVLIIFVDTLRFDRLGVSGYRRDDKSLTPRIDAFAKQGIVFERAFSQAPNTPRSVPSFLTSRYPSQVVVDDAFKDYPTNADENDFLFETLKASGMKTIGESSHFFFCDRVRYPDSCAPVAASLKPNALQGADEWDNSDAENIPESNHDIAGPRIVKKAIAKLDTLAKDKTHFAMLVHLFDPHSTYMEHEGFPITEHGTASLAQKYDYEVAFEDQLIGQLLDTLDRTGLAANTTVVLMADHGEAFGVHTIWGEQMFFHGQTLYRELLHVPLIFRVPNAQPCTRKDVVQLVDLAPTIAALFGATPPKSWIGRSLLPALECKDLPPRPAFAQLLPAKAWDHEAKSMITADGKYHVFFRISDKRWEIYDLEKDPDERHNIADSDPEAKRLEEALAQWSP
jgi:arylsulfatase A-like enzyme